MTRLLRRFAAALARRPGRTLGVLVLLGLIGLGVFGGAGSWWLRRQARAARAALERRDFPAAEAALSSALRFNPRAADLHLLKARLARLAGRPAEADLALDAAQRHGASPADVSLERTLRRVHDGDMTVNQEQALRAYVNGGHPETLAIVDTLSLAYIRSYRLADAYDALNIWLEQRPDDVEGLMRRGLVGERQDRFDDATRDYRRALELAPDHPEAPIRLGHLLLAAKDAKAALEVFEGAYARRPGDPVAGAGLAASYLEVGRSDEALKLLDTLLVDHPREPTLHRERGRAALALDRRDDALAALRQAVALLPFDYECNYQLWLCLKALGRDDEAKKVHETVLRIQNDMQLMRSLTDRLHRQPHDAQLRCDIARVFARNGEQREALLWFQAALQLDPNLRTAHVALAEHFEAAGDKAQAARHRALASGAPR